MDSILSSAGRSSIFSHFSDSDFNKKKIIVDGKWWAFEQGLLWSPNRIKYKEDEKSF